MEEDKKTISNTEEYFGKSRAPANSATAEFDRLLQESGTTESDQSVIPAQPEQEAKQGEEQTAASILQSGVEGNYKPKTDEEIAQSTAGVADVGSNIANFGVDVVQATDKWMREQGITKADILRDDYKIDFGSYVAPEASTPDEKMARNTGKFVTQMALFVGTGGTTSLLKSAGAAAVVSGLAFDPEEERLADFMQENGWANNMVTNYLASNEDDTALESRFKNVAESVLLDVTLASAFVGTVKMYKAARGAASKAINKATRTGLETVNDLAQNADETAQVLARNVDEGAEGAAQEAAKQTDEATKQTDEATKPLDENIDLAAETKTVDNVNVEGGEIPNQTTDAKKGGKSAASKMTDDVNVPLYEQLTTGITDVELKQLNKKLNINKLVDVDISKDSVMAKMLFENQQNLEAAGGKVLTTKKLDKAANKLLRDSPEKVLGWKVGDVISPEIVRAAEKGFAISANAVDEAAKTMAVAEKAFASGTINEVAFAQASADFFDALDASTAWAGAMKGTGAESGRLLNAAKRFSKESQQSTLDFLTLNRDKIKFAAGSQQAAADLAAQFRAMADSPDYGKHLKQVAEKSRWGKTKDSIYSTYMNIMLSNPFTHLKNKVSGTFQMTIQSPLESVSTALVGKFTRNAKKWAAEGDNLRLIEQHFGKTLENIPTREVDDFVRMMNQRVTLRESGARLRGTVQGLFEDAFTMRFMAEEGNFIIKTADKPGSFITQIPPEEFAKMGVVEKGLHFMSHFVPGMGGRPGKALGAVDGFMGSIFMRAEQRALSTRFALANEGQESFEVLFQRYMDDPPPWMQKMMAQERDARLYTASNTGLKPVENIKDAIRNTPGARVLAPFVTVDSNMTTEFMKRVPGLANILPEVNSALAAGGTARDVALGKMAFGSMALASGAFLASEGLITGDGPKNAGARQLLKAKGWKPNAVKFGDKYIEMKYLGMEGASDMFKFAADLHQIGAYVDDATRKDYTNLLTATGAIIADSITPDFIVNDIGKFLGAIRNPDSFESQNWMSSKANSLIPGAVRFANDVSGGGGRSLVVDPRNATKIDFIDKWITAFKANTPGLSDDLPPQRNIWGQAIEYDPGMGPNNASPIAFVDGNEFGVEEQLLELGVTGPLYQPEPKPGEEHLQLRMPSRRFQSQNVSLDLGPKEYDTFVRLSAGDMTPLVEVGLMSKQAAKAAEKDSLRNQLAGMMNSKGWEQLTDQTKRENIAAVISMRRRMAKEMLMSVHPELQMDQMDAIIEKMQARGGVNPQDATQMKGQVSQQREQLRKSKGGPSL